MSNKSLTIVGDVHGKHDKFYGKYLSRSQQFPHIVQLGDFGFSYKQLKNVPKERCLVVLGNHDNYDLAPQCKNCLGDFGYVENFGGFNFFYYRGAWSIDFMYRTPKVSWWEEEQVKWEKFEEVKQLYSEIKPDLMITHDCPGSLYTLLLPPDAQIFHNTTSHVLDELFKIHQPKKWFFGHHHQSRTFLIGKTEFRCLDELEAYTLTEDF